MDNLDQSSLWCSCGPIKNKKRNKRNIERRLKDGLENQYPLILNLRFHYWLFLSNSIQRSQGHSLHDPVYSANYTFINSENLNLQVKNQYRKLQLSSHFIRMFSTIFTNFTSK